MASTIVGYCGIVIDDVAIAAATYSDIDGSWNRAASIQDDGVNKWIFWGDTTGQITVFNLVIDATTCTGDCTTAIVTYGASTTLSFYQGHIGTANLVISLAGCYATGLTSNRLKLIGDKFVIEGGVVYQIFA